jgi:hypothetical protein
MNLLSLLIAPLQAVVLFFAPHAGTPRCGTQANSAGKSSDFAQQPTARQPVRPQGMAQRQATHGMPATGRVPFASPAARTTYPQQRAPVAAKPIHHVRVVRNVDSSLPTDRAGRMCVSGRFADVCAELDRLVAQQMRTA